MSTLKAMKRSASKANALRREGFVPAVVYGPTIESVAIQIDRKELKALFSQITRSSRIDLSIGNGRAKKLDVFIKAVQYDSVTDEPTHVDFYHPGADRPVKLSIPIKLVGQAPGVKSGGVLDVLLTTIPVQGLAEEIPNLLTLDVSSLEIGQGLQLRDLDLGGVTALIPAERTIVHVLAPRGVEETAVAAEEAEGAEEGAPAEEAGEGTEEA
jgi:large subunit ribosomal protein L25